MDEEETTVREMEPDLYEMTYEDEVKMNGYSLAEYWYERKIYGETCRNY